MSASFHSALLTITLFIPEANSLKARRSVVGGLKERIRNKFNVSVIECGELDLWQKATICIAGLGIDQRKLNREFDHILNYIEQQITERAQVTDQRLELW